MPMIPKQFKYEPQKSTYKQFKIVKSLYTRKDVERIYYAGDSGREGIYIQALIRNQIFRTAPKIDERVVWIDSYTEESILSGIRDAKRLCKSNFRLADWHEFYRRIHIDFRKIDELRTCDDTNAGNDCKPAKRH